MDRQEPVGWGVLGAAGVARRRFVPALRAARNARLVAVGSRAGERAAELTGLAGEGRPLGSYDAVLDDPAVEAVYIPLPNSLHLEWALRSLAAGKHVLCEKPLVMSTRAVEELRAAAAGARRAVMEAFMYRLHPQYEPATLEPLLERIGTVRAAHARLSFTFDRPGDIREQPALGGGALWDTGAYCLDALSWLLGDVAAVQAMGELRNDVVWSAGAQLRTTGGVLATAWWSFEGPQSQRLTLVGDRGVLDLDSPFRADGPARARLEAGGEPRLLELPAGDCFRREIEHFGEVARGRAAPVVPLPDSARWIGLAEDIERRVRAGATTSPAAWPSAAGRPT